VGLSSGVRLNVLHIIKFIIKKTFLWRKAQDEPTYQL